MKIPRCAPPWLMAIAADVIKAGADRPGMTSLSWIPNWNVSLRWIQQPTYCALAYQGEQPIDAAMRRQILDAFSRASQKKLVTLQQETPTSAICFFGGAPIDIPLDKLDFEKL